MSGEIEPVQRRPHLTWLRLLAAGLFLVAGCFVLAIVDALLHSDSLSHTKWIVAFAAIGGCGPASVLVFWLWWRLSGRYDTAEDAPDTSRWILAPQQGPDLARPDRVFVDGGFAYQIQVWPALQPLAGTRDNFESSGSALFRLAYEFLIMLVTRPFDPRSKTVVSRRLIAAGHAWGVVKIEFFADPTAAEARARAIVKDWDPAQFAAIAPLTRAQLRAARRANS